MTEEQKMLGDLLNHCRDFIREQKINCADVVYKSDRIIENVFDFLEGICEIVGYHEYED